MVGWRGEENNLCVASDVSEQAHHLTAGLLLSLGMGLPLLVSLGRSAFCPREQTEQGETKDRTRGTGREGTEKGEWKKKYTE